MPTLPHGPDDHFAASLRGFGPVGLLAMLVILSGNLLQAPLSALLVLAWAYRSRTPWREIGYVQPGHWWRDALLGIAGGLALRLLMQVIVMPLLGHHPINQQFHFLVGNTAALPGVVLFLLVVSGFGEETLFRGYLFERLRKALRQLARRDDRDRVADVGVLRDRSLPGAGLDGSEAVHDDGPGVWHGLRDHRPDLASHVGTRRIQSAGD